MLRVWQQTRRLTRGQRGSRFQSTLVGTVPSAPAHLVLTPKADFKWPARELSPTYAALSELLKGSGIDYSISNESEKAQTDLEDLPKVFKDGQEPDYTALLHRQDGSFQSPFNLNVRNIDKLRDWIGSERTKTKGDEQIYIYVCTHASRDCRCGTIGTSVYKELLRLSKKQRSAKSPIVKQISHVGGHVYAANVLVYPFGDWYGSITAEDAPQLYRAILQQSQVGTPEREKLVPWSKWRGRLGLHKDQQLALYDLHASSDKESSKSRRAQQLGDPVDLVFRDAHGDDIQIQAFEGETIKDAAKRHDKMEAICGGIQECATCHCYLNGTEGNPLPDFPETSDDEDEQLSFAINRKPTSRLGCCIPVTPKLGQWIQSGGKIELPRF